MKVLVVLPLLVTAAAASYAAAPQPVQDTPDVQAAKAEHYRLYNAAAAAAAAAPDDVTGLYNYNYNRYPYAFYGYYGHAAPAASYSYSTSHAYTAPLAATYAYSAPTAYKYTYSAPQYQYVAAPQYKYVATAPVHAVSSQYHSQDEAGNYQYGYNDGQSAKNEYRRFDGATVGSYSYLDSNGVVQHVTYEADAVNGFRVKGTNIPVAPGAAAGPVYAAAAPQPVDDTAEVKAAKAEHARLFSAAAAAAEAAPDTDVYTAPAPVTTYSDDGQPAPVYVAPTPVDDTYEVKAAKAEHARLYNAAAAAAAAAPDTGIITAPAPASVSYTAPAPAVSYVQPAPAVYVAPQQVEDTYEVKAAKAEHARLYNAAAAAAAAAPDTNIITAPAPVSYTAPAPAVSYVQPAPAVYVAPKQVEDTYEVKAAKAEHARLYNAAAAAAAAAPDIDVKPTGLYQAPTYAYIQPVYTPPKQVEDTLEVKAAKAEHARLYNAAAAAAAAAPDTDVTYSAPTVKVTAPVVTYTQAAPAVSYSHAAYTGHAAYTVPAATYATKTYTATAPVAVKYTGYSVPKSFSYYTNYAAPYSYSGLKYYKTW